MDSLCLGFLYFGNNSLRSIKREFFQTKEVLKWFGVCSIRVFYNFSLDPYYETTTMIHDYVIHQIFKGHQNRITCTTYDTRTSRQHNMKLKGK